MFENKLIKGIHVSRYIASWRNEGGEYWMADFEDWLMSLGLSVEEARYVWNVATCGKLELETNAKKFIEELRKTYWEEEA